MKIKAHKQNEPAGERVLIAPSLLSADFACLKDDIRQVEAAGCRVLHLDVMDGHFVPNLTIGPVVARAVRRVTGLYLGAHLMIEDPARYLTAFAEAGVNEITIHQEIEADFLQVIREIKTLGLRAGVSIRPATPVAVVEPALPYIDLILIMSVEPGFGGQAFIAGSEQRIAEARNLAGRENRDIRVAVDGGITVETAPLVVRSGATELIAGSAVFNGDIRGNIEALRRSIAVC
ncbi:MAG: ribulose-phosphate 3-epimerase [PVC group bacterium]